MKYIKSTAELELFVHDIIAEDSGQFIALDTEFVRVSTYWPQLCLIQIAGSKQRVIIDCLAENIDLTSLKKLLYNSDILKVLHSARQDLEIFYKLFDEVPYPLFDTQIADSFLGDSESVGFERIVDRLLGVGLDKSCQFTDWAKRPLSDKQLEYALNDVIYLRGIYDIVRARLEELSRLDWALEETARIYVPDIFIIDPANSWKKVKSVVRGAKFWARVREVAAWRELESQKLDVNRGKVMKDDVLTQLCQLDNTKDIELIKGLDSHYKTDEYIKLFTEMFDRAENSTVDRQHKFSNLSIAYKDRLQELTAAADAVAKELNISRSLLANKDDIIKMMMTGENPKLQTGWRKVVFTDKLFK